MEEGASVQSGVEYGAADEEAAEEHAVDEVVGKVAAED